VILAAALVTGARVYADRADLLTVPEQTPIHITLDQTVASDQVRSGDHFQATVTEPVDVNGRTVIPQGAHVEGLVVDARKSGRLMGRASSSTGPRRCATCRQDLRFAHPRLRSVPAATTKSATFAWIAGGAGGGALIGVAAAGGEGALIGGPVGAGAGTAVAYFTGKRNIHLRAETPLTFRLEQAVTIDVNKS